MKILQYLLCTVSIIFIPSVANAVVVTFEDITPENADPNVESFGFNFQSGFSGWLYTAPGGVVESIFSGNPHDSIRLAGVGDSSDGEPKVDLPGPGVQMTELGGGAFSVFGFDASTFATTQLTDTLTIEADLFAGGTISTTVDLTTSFQSFNLTGFEEVTSVSFFSTVGDGFLSDGFQIDNISTVPTEAVPEPTSILGLLTLGFGALKALSKRKRKSISY